MATVTDAAGSAAAAAATAATATATMDVNDVNDTGATTIYVCCDNKPLTCINPGQEDGTTTTSVTCTRCCTIYHHLSICCTRYQTKTSRGSWYCQCRTTLSS